MKDSTPSLTIPLQGGRNFPKSLLKFGINQMTDNLAPGEVLDEKKLSQSFFILFRTEMEDKVLGRHAKKSQTVASNE